jgi:hypothetical protein
VIGGLVAGACGAVALAAFIVCVRLFGGELPIISGLSVVGHLSVSLTLGILFGLWAHNFCRVGVLVGGLVFGSLVWFTMYFVVVPMLGMSELVPVKSFGASTLAHLIFGLALGSGFLPFRDGRETTELLKRPSHHVDDPPLPDLLDPV